MQFAALAAARSPAHGELLAALEAEFRPIDREGLEGAVDELARSLFGLESAPLDERAVALGRAAWAALPEEAETPRGWLSGSALEHGCAAGAVRAALAAELGRRAGIPAHPTRLRGCWAIHLRDNAAHAAADVGAESSIEPFRSATGCLCAHRLAFIVLTSLAAIWHSAGDSVSAQRARVLARTAADGRVTDATLR
jgi:hypothetical protein